MLIKCDILKYTLLFPGRKIWTFCKLLNACWSPLAALLHCLYLLFPCWSTTPAAISVVYSFLPKMFPLKGACFILVVCVCLKERHIIISGLFVFPLLIPTSSSRCHWQTQHHLLLFPLQIFSTWALFLTYNCWVSCYGNQLFQSSRPNECSLCGFDLGSIYYAFGLKCLGIWNSL